MAITFVGAAFASGTSVSLPSHQAGDTIIVYATRLGSTTPPTMPGTYTLIGQQGTSASLGTRTSSIIAGYRTAASGSEVSGTWTNATLVIACVYRGADPGDPIGAVDTASATGTTLPIPPLSLEDTSGVSWVCYSAIISDTSGDSDFLTLSGLTRRAENNASSPAFAAFDTAAGVSSWAGGSDSNYSNNHPKAVITFELKEAGPAGPTIDDVTPDTFVSGQAGIVITGSFSASGNTVELGDNATYASANKQVQTITAEDEDEITITGNLGSLTPGSLYVFVTDDDGNTSEGFPVTVNLNASILSVSSAASGSAGISSVLLDYLINGVNATATSTASASDILLDYLIAGVTATASATLFDPVIGIRALIESSLAQAASTGIAPELLYDQVFASVTAAAAGASNNPAVLYDFLIQGALAAAAAASNESSLSMGAGVLGQVASASAAGMSPSVFYDFVLESLTATATGAGLNPEILLRFLIESVTATASAEGFGSTLAFDMSFLSQVAQAGASGNLPNILYDAVISAAIAQAAAEMLEAGVSTQVAAIIESVIAQAQADLLLAVVAADRFITIEVDSPATAGAGTWKTWINPGPSVEDLTTNRTRHIRTRKSRHVRVPHERY